MKETSTARALAPGTTSASSATGSERRRLHKYAESCTQFNLDLTALTCASTFSVLAVSSASSASPCSQAAERTAGGASLAAAPVAAAGAAAGAAAAAAITAAAGAGAATAAAAAAELARGSGGPDVGVTGRGRRFLTIPWPIDWSPRRYAVPHAERLFLGQLSQRQPTCGHPAVAQARSRAPASRVEEPPPLALEPLVEQSVGTAAGDHRRHSGSW